MLWQILKSLLLQQASVRAPRQPLMYADSLQTSHICPTKGNYKQRAYCKPFSAFHHLRVKRSEVGGTIFAVYRFQ